MIPDVPLQVSGDMFLPAGSVFMPPPRRCRCTRGHAWEESRWLPEPFALLNADDKRVCPECLRAWLLANMGTVEVLS